MNSSSVGIYFPVKVNARMQTPRERVKSFHLLAKLYFELSSWAAGKELPDLSDSKHAS